MIRVTVQLISAVDPSRDKLLGVMEIANVGGNAVQADYEYELRSPPEGVDLLDYTATLSKWEPKVKEVWKRALVKGFDRQNRGAWDLLYLVLRNAVGSRNLQVPGSQRGKG